MERTQTVYRFRWGNLVPLILMALVCILLFAAAAIPKLYLAIFAGILLVGAGVLSVIAFFAGQPVHIARMMAGIAQVSVGVWALISCTKFSPSVLALGLGIVLVLYAAAQVFAAIGGRGALCRSAHGLFAAGLATTGVLLFVNNFVRIFPGTAAALATAGGVLFAVCLAEMGTLLVEGFYTKETLVYRLSDKGEA